MSNLLDKILEKANESGFSHDNTFVYECEKEYDRYYCKLYVLEGEYKILLQTTVSTESEEASKGVMVSLLTINGATLKKRIERAFNTYL